MGKVQCDNIRMDQERHNFFSWQLEQQEAERVKAALTQADSGHLVDHSRLKAMAAGWCKIEESKLDEVVVSSYKEYRINWSDPVVSDLQHMCKHLAEVWSLDEQPDTAERHVKNVLSTVELIASCPDVGRPGLVTGTREWGMGLGTPTIAYRYLLGEVQVLGVLVSHRKWPLMKSAPGWWAHKKSVS